jgi:large subunit ribosomal protein L1
MAGKDQLVTLIDQVKKESAERKFPESVEIAVNMKEIDLSNPKNRINDEVILPKGRGKELKVAVIGSAEMQQKAREGTNLVYGPEDISKFAENKGEFKKLANGIEFFVAESTLMANIGKSLGTVLGPRGKIPKPMPPGQDPSSIISSLKRTVRVRSRDRRTFHVPVGTRAMESADIAENLRAVVKRIVGKLEKGYGNIDSIYLKTTMGKARKIELEMTE